MPVDPVEKGKNDLAKALSAPPQQYVKFRLTKVISVNTGNNTAVVDSTGNGNNVTVDLASPVLPVVNDAIWVAEMGSGRWLGLFPWPRQVAAGAPFVLRNGAVIGQRPKLNFITGPGILINAADDPTNNEVDITHAVEQEYIWDSVAAFATQDASNTVLITHDDAGNRLTFTVNEEWLTDYLALHLLEGSGVTIDFNDATNSLVFNAAGGGSNHRHAERQIMTFYYPGILPAAVLDVDVPFKWGGFQTFPDGMFGRDPANPGETGYIWVESLTVTCDGQGILSPRNAQPFQVTVRQNGSGLAALTWDNSGSGGFVRQVWHNPFTPESGTFVGICFSDSIFRVDSAQNANDRAGVYVHMYCREVYQDGTGYHMRSEVVPT